MTFLNPAILWGLAAVSIPILIHIFNLRRTRKIEFSTLMFLKEIQQTRYRRIKLKQLLILLCRIGFVISLVLAFARPFASGYLGTAGETPHSSILFLLDDSFSMQEREKEGSSFDIAKKKLIETLGITGENDELYYSSVSRLGLPSQKVFYTSPGELKDSVIDAEISDVTEDMNSIVFFANRILGNSSNPYKEVFFFTDGQKSTLSTTAESSNIMNSTGITKFNIVLTSDRTGNNLSIDTVNVVTKIFEKNKNVKLRAVIDNHNDYDVMNKSVVVNYSGAKNFRDEKAIDIPANSTVETEFSINPDVTGYTGGYVELIDNILADDELINDNKRYFAFRIPDKVKLLFVSPSSSDLDFVKLALTSSEELMKDTLNNKADFFDIKQDEPSEMIKEQLSDYDCIIICGKQGFTQDEADKLFSYMQNGGGVIIYPGSGISIDNYNRVLMKTLDLPFINPPFTDAAGDQPFRFDKIDFEHPVFDGIFTSSSPKQDYIAKQSPAVRSGIGLLTGTNSIPLIKLNNGNNFLVEYNCGKGKLLFYSVSPDMNNSDFPSSELFAPITVRSVLYLANRNPVKEAVTGENYFLDTKDLGSYSPKDSIRIVTNIGAGIGLSPADSGLINMKFYTLQTSDYRLMQNGKVLFEYPANFNKKESVLDKFSSSELTKLFREKYRADINVFTANEKLTASILSSRSGSEIWKYFFILALLFLALEYYISKSILIQNPPNP